MPNTHRIRSPVGRAAILALALLPLLPGRSAAHEIPASVTVLSYVKVEGDRLRLVLRVPLESIRDVEIPISGPGYLDIAAVQPVLRDAAQLWIADYLEIYEGDRRLDVVEITGTRISLPSDRSFERYDFAVAHFADPPLPAATQLPWQQAMFDVMLEYPIEKPDARFAIRPGLAHLGLRTFTVLRYIDAEDREHTFQYLGNPGLVRLDPRWYQAAVQFVRLGFAHILDGIDHLLFVFCLVIPFRRFRPLVAIITAFTVAHSITLIASAAGFGPTALWFPPLIETLIALSILWMAFENIAGARLDRRWIMAFGFGLVHGFGFSFLLRESLQFAGSHVTTSLLAFNVGVELGQLFVIALLIPVLELLFRHVVAERMGTILLSALVAHTAWHWMTERFATLREFEFRWPVLDAAFLASLVRALMLVLVMAGAIYLLNALAGRMSRGKSTSGAAGGAQS